jgi:hypothetical protein
MAKPILPAGPPASPIPVLLDPDWPVVDLARRLTRGGLRLRNDADGQLTLVPHDPLSPLRRCEDCRLDLCRDVLRAIGACPRWGKSRHGVESHCPAFVAKDGAS